MEDAARKYMATILSTAWGPHLDLWALLPRADLEFVFLVASTGRISAVSSEVVHASNLGSQPK